MPRNRELMWVFKYFIKVIFSFSLSTNDNVAIGDINGDNQNDREKVLLLLKEKPGITAKEMSEQTGLSTRKISLIIRELRKSEVIIRMGSNRKGHWEINKSKF